MRPSASGIPLQPRMPDLVRRSSSTAAHYGCSSRGRGDWAVDAVSGCRVLQRSGDLVVGVKALHPAETYPGRYEI